MIHLPGDGSMVAWLIVMGTDCADVLCKTHKVKRMLTANIFVRMKERNSNIKILDIFYSGQIQ